MTTTSYKISSDLFLVEAGLTPKTTEEITSVNHVLVIDCSGSMCSDLPKIRQQCKNKLPKMLGEEDTVSIIWFSGRGEFGTLVEAEKVVGLKDLQAINKAIDRWLQPVGLTGFKEPVLEVKALTERVAAQNPGAFNLFFMSDGCDNQWSKEEILGAIEETAPSLGAATFVEYGYYADRPMLTEMAERSGGQLVFSQDFDRYDAALGSALATRIQGRETFEVPTADYMYADLIGNIVYSLGNNSLITYRVNEGKIFANRDTTSVWFLSPTQIGTLGEDLEGIAATYQQNPDQSFPALNAAYAALSLWSVRMQPKVVRSVLRGLGDVNFINQFSNCFGKQAYTQFMEDTQAAAFNTSAWYRSGFDPNAVPKEDAFTAIQMLDILSSDSENRVLLGHERFSYSKISRARVDANLVLNDAEQAEVTDLQLQLSATKDAKEVARISARISEISNKPDALVFAENEEQKAQGYSISSLTFNESRPNVSILVKKNGTVNLSSRSDRPSTVPETINTFVYRNYSVIKDGMINIQELPLRLSEATKQKLAEIESELPSGTIENIEGGVTIVKLGNLPVINGQMASSVSAEQTFKTQYELLKIKGSQKVYNSFFKEEFSEDAKDGAWADTLGTDSVAWLKEQGITEYNGFSPKSVQAESTDYYMGKELKVNLKGYSTLPSLNAVRKSIKAKKVNAVSSLMVPAIEEVEQASSNMNPEELKSWLIQKKTWTTEQARSLMFDMAKSKFAIVVGQVWFNEFESINQNSLDVEIDGTTISGSVEMKEIQVKI